MIDLQRLFSCDMLENAGHENDGSSWTHHQFVNDDMVRTKVTSYAQYTFSRVTFQYLVIRHCARSALRPFGITPNDIRHSARSTSFSPFGIPPFSIPSRSHLFCSPYPSPWVVCSLVSVKVYSLSYVVITVGRHKLLNLFADHAKMLPEIFVIKCVDCSAIYKPGRIQSRM